MDQARPRGRVNVPPDISDGLEKLSGDDEVDRRTGAGDSGTNVRRAPKEITGGGQRSREGGAVASVLPREAGENGLLAEIAGRHSLPLVPVGSGTGSRPEDRPGSLLVRFDLMRAMRLPQHGQEWVEVEPETPWLNVDDVLRRRGMSLTVYPFAPSLVPANATREFFPRPVWQRSWAQRNSRQPCKAPLPDPARSCS